MSHAALGQGHWAPRESVKGGPQRQVAASSSPPLIRVSETPSDRLPRFRDFFLVPILYYLGAKLGVWLTVMPEGTAILWPPNSVLLTVLLVFQGRGLVPFAALAIAAEVAADVPTFTVIEAVLFGLTNVAEATLAFWLLRRLHFDRRFAALEDLPKFVVAGPLVGASVAAAFGALIYSYFRGGETGYLEFLRVWWFGDALGLMIFTPALLGLWSTAGDGPRPTALRPLDGFVGLIGLAAMGALAASRDGMLLGVHIIPLILLPFVIFAAARLEIRWAALVAATAALVVVTMVSSGRNPFGNWPPRDTVMRAQEFIFLMSLMALGLSGLLSQLRAKQGEIELANQRLQELNQALEARVGERTTELQTLNAQLEQLALTDGLTGLPNRRAFVDVARREFARSQRHRRPLAVAMCDLDHFKSVNDHYGHQVGDAVLQRFVAVTTGMIRASVTMARYGGEEFVFLVPETMLSGAVTLMERIRQALRAEAIDIGQGTIRITASFGVAMLMADDKDLDQLLGRADRALYEAKAGGRDCVVAADSV